MFDCYISSKVLIERREVGKKVIVLSYQFECLMEFGNASLTRRHPLHPQGIERFVKNYMQMQIVAMLQGMESDSSLKGGSMTTIAKKVWHGMLHSSLLMEVGSVHACMPQD